MSAGSYYDQCEQAGRPVDDQPVIDLDTVDTNPAPVSSAPRPYSGDLPATERQFAFIRTLIAERDISPELEEKIEQTRDWWREGTFNRITASHLIDDLMHAPRHLSHPGPGAAPTDPEDSAEAFERAEASRIAEASKPEANTVHMYLGKVYRVRESQRGYLYAEELIGEPNGRTGWHYSRGTIGQLSTETKITSEQAAQYGQAFGICAICGRTLTNPTSVELGIGPVCRTRI